MTYLLPHHTSKKKKKEGYLHEDTCTTDLGDDVTGGDGAERGGDCRDQDLLRQPLRGHQRGRQAQGNATKNEIFGLRGADYIAGKPRADELYGNRGQDEVRAGNGRTACSAAGEKTSSTAAAETTR